MLLHYLQNVKDQLGGSLFWDTVYIIVRQKSAGLA